MMVLALSRKYFDFPKRDAEQMVKRHWARIWSMHEQGDAIYGICMAVIDATARAMEAGRE